jgi:hypothetical protein
VGHILRFTEFKNRTDVSLAGGKGGAGVEISSISAKDLAANTWMTLESLI